MNPSSLYESPKVLAINPRDPRAWEGTSSARLMRQLMEGRMFPLTLDGLEAGLKELQRGASIGAPIIEETIETLPIRRLTEWDSRFTFLGQCSFLFSPQRASRRAPSLPALRPARHATARRCSRTGCGTSARMR